MQVFLLDVWHDLREKRLAPVAIVLLLGLVAVPVLLAKPAEDPGPAPVVAAPKKADNEALAALTKVKLGDQELGSGRGSTLGVFDPDNPFHPPKGTIKKDDVSVAGAGPSTGSQGSPGAGSTGAPACDRRRRRRREPPAAAARPAAPVAAATTTTTTTTIVYKYVVDLTFTANGHTRHIKGLEKLDMLPNQSSPLLIFMGVTPEGRRRGVPRGLDARGRRRGPLQAERGRVRLRLHRRRLPVHVHRRGRRHLRRSGSTRSARSRSAPAGASAKARRARRAPPPAPPSARPDASFPRSWPTS